MSWASLIVAGIGVVVAYVVGRKQGRNNERAYQLNIRQATPRIGSRVEFFEIGPVNQGHQFRYVVKTTIYNDGSLVASKLDGQWKLSCSYKFLNAEQVIRADSLPSFLPMYFEHELGYHRHEAWFKAEVTIKFDIDLSYRGFEDKPERYQATYEFDPKSGKMIQSVKNHQ